MMSAAVPWDGRIHRHTLPKGTDIEIFAFQFGQRAAAAEQRGHIALFPRVFLDILHIFCNARIGRQIGADKLARFLTGHADILRKRKTDIPYTIPKLTALQEERICGVTSSMRHMVYLGRGRGVDILPGSKRLDHVRVLRDMRKHTQFDLRVIRVDQHMLRVGRDDIRRNSRPSSVRTGMFCRFGSVEDSRPVAVTVC